jgi:iron complex transport system substrate-binding protein
MNSMPSSSGKGISPRIELPPHAFPALCTLCFRPWGEATTIPGMPRFSLLLFIASTSLACLSLAAQAADAPQRIVSMNLCSDQLLLLLAERTRIASLSYLAADPGFSPVAAQTNGLHLNHGQAEELLPLAPDLVLSGAFSATLATNLLERLGIEVLRLGVANSASDIYTQVGSVAARIGATPRAQHIVNTMQQDIAAYIAQLRAALQGKSAVFFSSNGFTYGSHTLQDDFIISLGMHNAAAQVQGPAQLSLEALLLAEPDFLFINPPARLDKQLAHPLLQHAALAALQGRMQVIELPDRYFECASPLYVQAYAALARQL